MGFPNLDGMNIDDLEELGATSEEEVGRRYGLDLLDASRLVVMAAIFYVARKEREQGLIRAAIVHENYAEYLYHELPPELKW